jgi:hypothetical protein
MAQTFRPNPRLNIEQIITELGVGEALVSFLEEDGTPAMVDRAFVCPPESRVGVITPDERQEVIRNSIHFSNYELTVDRESAFEVLRRRTEQRLDQAQPQASQQEQPRSGEPAPRRGPGRPRDTIVEAFAKSTMRSIGNTIGRQIVRGLLGSILGGRR